MLKPNMSSGQASGGQQDSASSGASREANLKQRKYSTNQGKKSPGGTDKSKTRVRTRETGDETPGYTKPSAVSTVTTTIQKVRRIYSVAIFVSNANICLILFMIYDTPSHTLVSGHIYSAHFLYFYMQ